MEDNKELLINELLKRVSKLEEERKKDKEKERKDEIKNLKNKVKVLESQIKTLEWERDLYKNINNMKNVLSVPTPVTMKIF